MGPFFNRAKASVIRKKGVPLAHVPGHGWRRVVPSPRPLEIVEGETVRALGGQDVVVIAAGGGGIPVTRHRGRLRGVDAVIDKDLASAVLAHDVGARELVLLTDVRKVSLDFQQPSQTDLDAMTASEAERYAARGHFPPGSMGPKVEAAAMFVRGGGKRAIITSPGFLGAALEGKDGTCVTP
ncbi:MAG: hypothetical protein FJ317_08865 [SAR202 cluster bacterium]|nr:hypothetical protein [SAR202 cluster bacterium]